MTEIITCEATRHGRTWVAHVPAHDVYGSGRTLGIVREDVREGLAAFGVTGEVEITPVMPELEALRSAEAAYEQALAAAVTALRLRKAPLRDIAEATRVTTPRVKRLLTKEIQSDQREEGESS
ncbi:hypothetical protein [Streptomyces halstedii]|uniref:Uncharacterized protein n=1 Tax=Streptomyces halstedii TaxID=1944 RepID=A0A6N9TY13_STRHA|nr:hypothetical protein [Streptomyces halstedii]NEA15449.1 hypothetical protein [Streptomyces halstedii]